MLNVGIGLVSNPQILLVDEPTAGIDKAAHERLYTVLADLRSRGLSILLTTHDLNDVSRLASRALILVNGQLRAEGSVEELIHERFRDHKEVVLKLNDNMPAVLGTHLAELGLQPQGSTSWHGLIGSKAAQLDKLYQLLSDHQPLIKDFSLRDPGLDLLIAEVTVDTEAAP